MLFSTIASWPVIIWKALEVEGIDPNRVFTAANADVEQLKNPNARISMSVITRLWDEASKQSSATCFGLAAAHQWHPTTFHALGLAWFASPSLEAAFNRFQRYSSMLNTAIITELNKEDNRFHFSITMKDKKQVFHPEGAHAALAIIVQMCRTSIGEDFKPIEVHMMQDKTKCDKALRQYFGCNLLYGHDHFELIMASEDIEKKLSTSNLELLKSADDILNAYQEKLGSDDIVSEVRLELIKQLPSGKASEESIADSLHMSLRTLQRRLTDRNETYRSLLNSVRKELAIQYISTPGYSMTEITYLLGFTEPSSFARSFKRWTGYTPSQQRALNS